MREVGIEPTETVPTHPAAFAAIRAAALPLARDAHPFALTLQSYRGRGLSGSRLSVPVFQLARAIPNSL